ncbi:hypothetical protein [Xenorhabdus bovienii]|uniref:hypothetical protein n=1 Tax=Xenorhabdus bovienii TaxID=40576 RepID=UPI0023B26B1D|nr:hypothetical protein [Xenorhabdus bovienii]MDE9488136.1 hypothetical protein [Xenorhabdus bovienii]
MILRKQKTSTVIFILITLISIISGAYYIHMQKYQMAVLVPSYDENSSEFPNKKVWFDASEWLSTNQYIKVNDFYLINKRGVTIDNLNSTYITMQLQYKIDDSESFFELKALKNMDPVIFFNLMKNKISYEYLYTQFDDKSLKPVQDIFLIKFSYKEKNYEVFTIRELHNNEHIYSCIEFIYKEGEWHKSNRNLLTYRDYLADKTKKN